MQWKHILRWGAGCGIELRGTDLRVVAVKSRPGSFKVLGRMEIADFRSRPALEWGAEYATFLRDLKLSHLAATVSLPRSEIVVRQLRLPPLNRKELGAAVGYQLETLHPYEADQVYTAFAPLRETAEGVNQVPVAVLIAQKAIVDGYADLFESAGVAVASFTAGAAAFYTGVRVRWDSPPAPFLIADFQPDGIEIYGEGKNRPLFSGTFASQSPERVLSLAGADLRLQESEPASVVFCGADGGEDGSDPLQLAGDLGDTFSLRSATELLPSPAAAVPEFDEGRDAAALAVALESACPRLGWRANLLPAARRKRNSHWMYAPTAVLVAALILLAFAYPLRRVIQDRSYLQKLEAETARLEQDVSRAAAAKSQGRESAARIQVLKSLRARSEVDLRIVRELSQQLPDTAWLSNLEIRDEGVQMYGEAVAAAPLLATVNGTRTLENAAFMTSLVKTDNGERFQIAAQRSLTTPERDVPAADSTAGLRAPSPVVEESAPSTAPDAEEVQ